jgi:hypothetical protein
MVSDASTQSGQPLDESALDQVAGGDVGQVVAIVSGAAFGAVIGFALGGPVGAIAGAGVGGRAANELVNQE